MSVLPLTRRDVTAGSQPVAGCPVGLCAGHLAQAVEWFAAESRMPIEMQLGRPCSGCDLKALRASMDGAVICQACGHTETVPAEDLSFEPFEQPAQQVEVVYYMRFADRIKIGTTVDLPRRLGDLHCDALLGYELGGHDLEKRRHRQFFRSRVIPHREWFFQSEELLAHIAALPCVG